jgi:hypothetical protein
MHAVAVHTGKFSHDSQVMGALWHVVSVGVPLSEGEARSVRWWLDKISDIKLADISSQ